MSEKIKLTSLNPCSSGSVTLRVGDFYDRIAAKVVLILVLAVRLL